LWENLGNYASGWVDLPWVVTTYMPTLFDTLVITSLNIVVGVGVFVVSLFVWTVVYFLSHLSRFSSLYMYTWTGAIPIMEYYPGARGYLQGGLSIIIIRNETEISQEYQQQWLLTYRESNKPYRLRRRYWTKRAFGISG
jgi:hypothetical protein